MLDDFVGNKAIVKDKITPGHTGKVEYRGTLWNAESSREIEEGETVIIEEKIEDAYGRMRTQKKVNFPKKSYRQ